MFATLVYAPNERAILLKEYLDQLESIIKPLNEQVAKGFKKASAACTGLDAEFGLVIKRQRIEYEEVEQILAQAGGNGGRRHIFLAAGKTKGPSTQLRDDSVVEVAQHLSSIERLRHVAHWILKEWPEAEILGCNLTTTHAAWKEDVACKHDLVVRVAVGDRHQILVVEITDTSGTGWGKKFKKDQDALKRCICDGVEPEEMVRCLLAAANPLNGEETKSRDSLATLGNKWRTVLYEVKRNIDSVG